MFNFKKKMEKKNESALDRKFRDCDFEDVAEVIKGGKELKSMKYANLIEDLVSQLKGKDVRAAVEIISTVAVLLTIKELIAIMECIKEVMRTKMAKELLKKAKTV